MISRKLIHKLFFTSLTLSIGTGNIPDAIARIKEEVKFMEELYKLIDQLGEASITAHQKRLALL